MLQLIVKLVKFKILEFLMKIQVNAYASKDTMKIIEIIFAINAKIFGFFSF